MSMKIHETAVSLQQSAASNIVVCEVIGKLSKEDYGEFTPLLEQAIAAHGKVRLLCLMTDFGGGEAGARWEDLKFDVRHHDDFSRIAVVGESTLEEWGVTLSKPFFGAEMRFFPVEESGEAEAWLQESAAAPGSVGG